MRAAEEEAATEIATDDKPVVTAKAAEGGAVCSGSVYLLQRNDCCGETVTAKALL